MLQGNNPADLLLDFVAGRDFERVQEAAGGAVLSLTHGSGSGSYADLSRTYDASEFAAAGGEASFKPASGGSGSGLDSSQQSTALLESTASATAAAAAFNELPEHSRFLAIMWRRRTAEAAAKGAPIGGIATAGAGGATGGRLADVLTRGGSAGGAPASDRPFVFQLASLNSAPLEGAEASAVTVVKPAFNLEAISSVRGASFLYQVYLVHNRSVKQQYRRVGGYLLEMGVTMLAGGMMGAAASQLDSLYQGILKPPYTLISPAPLETMLPSLGFYVSLAVGIAGSPAGVLTFGEEKHVYYREVAAGHNSLAYYIGKSLSVLYRFTLGEQRNVPNANRMPSHVHALAPHPARAHALMHIPLPACLPACLQGRSTSPPSSCSSPSRCPSLRSSTRWCGSSSSRCTASVSGGGSAARGQPDLTVV